MPHVGARTFFGVEREYLRVALDRGLHGMRRCRLAETHRQLGEIGGTEGLIAEEQHLVLEQRGADCVDRGVVDTGLESDTAYDCAERRGNWGHVHAARVCEANW